MLFYLREIILFLHILLGISWLGGILFVGWGVYPTANKLTYPDQQHFLYLLMKRTHLLLTLLGLGVISTGIILGTLLGPLHSWDVIIDSRYGHLFSLAFMIATVSLLWGGLISYNVTMTTLKNRQLWDAATNGTTYPLKRMMKQLTFISSIEVLGLCIVVWIMVLI